MPITNQIKSSFLTMVGITASLVTLTVVEPSQAMGFGALDLTNTTFFSPFITRTTSSGGTIIDFGTASSVVTNDSSDSVTINIGDFGSFPLPIVGGGIFYQATETGTVSFDWTFANAGSQDFFAYVNLGTPQDIENSVASLLSDPSSLNSLPIQPLTTIVNALLSDSTVIANLVADPQGTLGDIYDAFDHDDLQYGNNLNPLLYPGGTTDNPKTITFGVKKGDIFGFAAGLAADKLPIQGSGSIGSFTLANSSFTAQTTPTDVPTPAAVLPVLSGLYAAARRQKKK